MPLTDADNARLYSDAFQRTAKTMMGEQSFAYADLKAQFDVAQAQIGVLQDELAASQKELADLKEAEAKAASPPADGQADPE